MPDTTADGFPFGIVTDPFALLYQSTEDMATFLQDNFTPWTAYAPAIAGLTLGNGIRYAAYRRWLDTVEFTFDLTFGSTTAVTDTLQIEYAVPGLPHGPNISGVSWASAGINGSVQALDQSVPLRRVGTLEPSVAGFAYLIFDGAAQAANGAVPWAWAVNDHIKGYGRYQVALEP